MKKILSFLVLFFVILVVTGSFASVASACAATSNSCESITLSALSAPGSTAVLTPGPINLSGNGTFSVPAGTYTATWYVDNANYGVVNNVVVPSCSYTVTATAGTNGAITPASQQATSGTTAAFTVTPDTGYQASMSGTCLAGTLVGTLYTTGNITGDCTVIATFTAIPVKVNGGWSDWSAKEDNACGHSGTQTRTCTNPNPSNGGADCSLLDGGDSSKTYTNESCSTPVATISAKKIICPTENLLPNWGNNGPSVTATTASQYVIDHPTCHIEPWTFEWAPNNTVNPGDQMGVAGGVWTAFTGGTTTIPSGALVWVREQFNSAYIPFTGLTTTQNVSAELYCSTDVLNYDNYDWIDPVVAGQTYNCVGFNVLAEPENTAPIANAGPDQIITLPTSSVTLSGSGTDSDGTISSYAWSFVSGPSTVDPTDTASSSATGLVEGTYVFQLTVTDNDGATGTDTVSITVNSVVVSTPQCSDNVDNSDEEDTLADELDPGCHTDGNASNGESYNPNDNNETNVPQCSNTGDDDGDGLIDALDSGCHSDGDVNNPSSYVPSDNDENSSPIANAGPDQIITLPTSSVTLSGSGTDSDGTISSYAWSFVSGPSTVDPTDTASSSATGLVEGTYVFQLTVTDNDGATGTDTVSITVNPESVSQQHSSSGSRSRSGSIQSSPAVPEGRVLGASTCGPYLYTYMKYGSSRNDKSEVVKLQIFLNEYQNAGLVADGIYGPKTYNAVKVFQVTNSTEVLSPWVSAHYLQSSSVGTGWMYKTTQRWVNMIKCPELNLPMPVLVID